MELRIALAGNPNCGKTTLFNALTGSNQFVGNWPGVTQILQRRLPSKKRVWMGMVRKRLHLKIIRFRDWVLKPIHFPEDLKVRTGLMA